MGRYVTPKELFTKVPKKPRMLITPPIRRLLLTLSAAMLLVACSSDVIYNETHAVDENGWDISDTLRYTLNVSDTQTIYNLFLDLRISRSYPYSNAFLFLNTTFPDGGVALDTLECPLAYPDGRWRGKEGGRYVDNRYYFKKQVIFPNSGTYHFAITHGMRDTVASGIKDVGLTLTTCTND